MNKQRKVLITTTYNEMGVIIDTKAEEVAQPNLQPTCNQLTTDTISRQQAIDALQKCRKHCIDPFDSYHIDIQDAENQLMKLPTIQPERAEGHWINGKCDRCGGHAPFWAMASTYYNSKYCPNCGTKMKGETT